MFDVANKRDDILATADNNNGDEANKKSTKNQEDSFDAVEDNRDNSDTNKTTPLDGFDFFFRHFNPDLPFIFSVAVIFCGVDVFFFVMVSSTNDS
jgi:hypothetical protein